MKTFDFTLSEPIKYQKDGANTEASMLELTSPAVNNRKKVARMKQGFMRVIGELPESAKLEAKESADKKEDDEKEKTNPREILSLLQMGSIDYADYVDIFVSLLTSGICKVEGETPITAHMLDKVSFEDIEKLMGEYFVNFILTSMEE